jgi:ribosomal-protein-alanine N-acetyltransferase
MVSIFRARTPSMSHLVPLRADDVPTLRRPVATTLTTRALREHIARHPHLAWRTPSGTEYVVGGYWRRRDDIGTVEELSARYEGPALVERLLLAHAAAGVRLVVLASQEADLRERFYRQVGFREIDRIVRMEKLDRSVPRDDPPPDVSIRPYEPADATAVLAVERHAFDWLWWNSAAELERYSRQPGVRLVVAEQGDRVVGYSGLTIYRRDGHLDRLAVHRDAQGRGVGRWLLADALRTMYAADVRWIGLTTQTTNHGAQALYRAFGFVHTAYEIALIGRWLTGGV